MKEKPESLESLNDAYERRVRQLTRSRKDCKKVVGTFCLYVPDEIIFATGADRVVLCGGRNDTISVPRSSCPGTSAPW